MSNKAAIIKMFKEGYTDLEISKHYPIAYVRHIKCVMKPRKTKEQIIKESKIKEIRSNEIINLYEKGISQNQLVHTYKYKLGEIKEALFNYTGLENGADRLKSKATLKRDLILKMYHNSFATADDIRAALNCTRQYVIQIIGSESREYRPKEKERMPLNVGIVKTKTDTYYKNEMNYGTYKPTYTIEEVESEYDTIGKPPTMFGACRVIGRQEC